MDRRRSENPILNSNHTEQKRQNQYVRKQTNRRSVGSISDWSDEDLSYINDEELSTDKLTRKQKKAMPQLKHDISYGQYLHMPKAQRAIFTSQATKHRNKIIIQTIIIIALVVLVYFLIKSFV